MLEAFMIYLCVFSLKQKLMPEHSTYQLMAVEVEEPEDRIHTVVVDGSSFTFIDSVGLHALPSVSISQRCWLIKYAVSKESFCAIPFSFANFCAMPPFRTS